MTPRLLRAMLPLLAAVAVGGAGWVDPPPAKPAPAAAEARYGAPAAPADGLQVSRWTLSGGRLSMTFEGDAAAVERLRQAGRLAVEVRWAREAGSGGAPNLVTPLTIGRPELAPAFANEVRRQGHFTWHSWAAKSAFSPGKWSVSLTYPDGRPVLCAEQQGPCVRSFTAG